MCFVCRKSNGIIQSRVRSILLYTYTHKHSVSVCLPVQLCVCIYVCCEVASKNIECDVFCKSIFVFEGVSKTTHTTFNICIYIVYIFQYNRCNIFACLYDFMPVFGLCFYFISEFVCVCDAREALEVWYDECVYHTNSP